MGALIEDFAENTNARLLIMLDDYPHMIDNIITSGENGLALAAEFLDAWREIRPIFYSAAWRV